MGSRLAGRLLAAGHVVTVWNRSADRMAPLADAGAVAASTPADCVADAEFVITMLSDPSALEAVSEGPDGVIAGIGGGTVWLEMSTVGPAAIARLAEQAPPGVDLVDAPVLGSLGEVEAGTLTIFVGGAADAVERCLPLLEALGTPLRVGELGSGARAKLVANTTLVTLLGALGEAIRLGDALGLDRATTFEVLAATPLAAQAERRRHAIEGGDDTVRFALSLANKDARLILEAAAAGHTDLPVVEAAASWFAAAEAAGLGELDYSAVLSQILGRQDRSDSRISDQ
jgi:3-hydroxyisobutyrate dehydrogenase-like beta-hydroxyacid dehydrogenase